MKRRSLPPLSLIVQLSISAVAQTPTAQPQAQPSRQQPSTSQQPDSDDDVVKISTKLVQVDVVVTDKNGKPVADLKPEEVQIFEDGRPQKITHFSYVVADS